MSIEQVTYKAMRSELEKRVAIKRELLKRSLENSFYKFVIHFFRVVNPTEELVVNWHIKYLCDLLQAEAERVLRKEKRNKHLIINVPPRSLKSFVCTVAFPAWSWIKHPGLKFIGSSYSGDLSKHHNMLTKEIVMSDDYQNFWGDFVQINDEHNTNEYFETSLRGIRTCTSTGGTVTGTGGDFVIVDDPINPKKAESDAERSTANKFFTRTLRTRLDNQDYGMFIIIMQRLHVNDLTGHLLSSDNKDDYRHICIPAELSSDLQPKELEQYYNDGLFFPRRFSRELLDRFRVDMGSYGYYGQMQQKPFIEGGGMVKSAWFGRFRLSDLPSSVVWNFFGDTAYTKKTTNDPTGLLSVAYYKGNYYVRDFAAVYKEFPELIKWIPKRIKQNGYTNASRLYIEPKASGISVAQELRRRLPINAILSDPPKEDKVTRFNSVSPIIESGRVFLLEGAAWLDLFLGEIEAFPRGQHDEVADLLSIALKKGKRGGGGTRYTFPRSN